MRPVITTTLHGWCLTDQHTDCVHTITGHKCGCKCHKGETP